MNQESISKYGNSIERVERAITALVSGKGVLLVDDENRENEGDLIFPAETITKEQMALQIRECSGIVCLCLTPDRIEKLGLPQMVAHNTSVYQTAFTVSIEAAERVTTGVSAADRVTTIRCAVAEDAGPETLHSPGHVFPLRAAQNGVFERKGHTEGTVDLMRLAGFSPTGVLCELTNADGTMARVPRIIEFADEHGFSVLCIEDIVEYRSRRLKKSA
jgi:3,4-dihydroxy 2-butanone 4-phosphate synthase